MSKKDTELYKKLSQPHPDYTAWKGEWQRYSDVLGDKEPFDKTDYLIKGDNENMSFYEMRVRLAEFIPESPLAIDKISGALFKEIPKRELNSVLNAFITDVTMNGDSLDDFDKDIVTHLMGYGITHILVNVNYPEGVRGKLTRKQEQDYKVRPFLVQYTPDAVIDWAVDSHGNLEMVRIFEESTQWDKTTFTHKPIKRFIQYDRQAVQWWTFQSAGKGWEVLPGLSDKKDHGLGVVPMICKSLQSIRPMIGRSFIRYSSSADVQKFRAESDMVYDAYIHAHPTLKVWTERTLKEVGIGTNTVMKLNPAEPREDADYVATPTSAFNALQAIANDRRESVYRQAKTDPLGLIGQNPMQASGVARAWSFGTSEARMLTHLAGKMEDIERAIFDLVMAYQSAGKYTGAITYPTEFDMSSLSQLIDDTEKITTQINSPTLIRVLHKRIAAAKVGNVEPEVIQQISEEIDNNELKSEAKLPSMEEMEEIPPTTSELPVEEEEE